MVTVLRPSGNPAASTDVAFAAPGQYVRMNGRGFSRIDGVVLSTDAKGQFTFSPDESIARVFAANAEGFGEISPSALLESGKIQTAGVGPH